MCINAEKLAGKQKRKQMFTQLPTRNIHSYIAFFLPDDFFSFPSLFWKGFWQIRRKMHWQRSWHFQVRHLWRNPSARVVEEHIFQLSFQSRKQSISPSSARPYHTIPYPFSHSVYHGSLVCCRRDQRDYIGNLETCDNFLTNLHSRGFRGVACHQQLAFWYSVQLRSKSIDSTNVQNEI